LRSAASELQLLKWLAFLSPLLAEGGHELFFSQGYNLQRVHLRRD
jgi:hypothetical protein